MLKLDVVYGNESLKMRDEICSGNGDCGNMIQYFNCFHYCYVPIVKQLDPFKFVAVLIKFFLDLFVPRSEFPKLPFPNLCEYSA